MCSVFILSQLNNELFDRLSLPMQRGRFRLFVRVSQGQHQRRHGSVRQIESLLHFLADSTLGKTHISIYILLGKSHKSIARAKENRLESLRFKPIFFVFGLFSLQKVPSKKVVPLPYPYRNENSSKKWDKHRAFRHWGHHIPGICRTYSSIRFALAVFMASETCPYTSRVKAAVA